MDLALQGICGSHSVEVSELLGVLNRVVAHWLQVEERSAGHPGHAPRMNRVAIAFLLGGLTAAGCGDDAGPAATDSAATEAGEGSERNPKRLRPLGLLGTKRDFEINWHQIERPPMSTSAVEST